MSIIALSGYAGSGKDLVGQFIQLLNSPEDIQKGTKIGRLTYVDDWWLEEQSGWEIKKFAGKLKHIASMLTGIPKHKFEDQEFKKTELSTEWSHQVWNDPDPIEGNDYRITSRENYGDTSLIQYGGGSEAEVPNHEIVTKQMTVRDFLQQLGTDGLRDGLHTNVWVNALFADYTCTHADRAPNGLDCPNWIITDCRFPNEAQAVKDHGGIIIRINRPGITAVNAHPSETSLDGYAFDAVIDNDGTIEDLYNKVKFTLEKQNVCYP